MRQQTRSKKNNRPSRAYTMRSTTKVPRKTTGLRHHVRMAVVPHAANEYRPHLLRWQGISAVLLAVVFFQSIYFAIQQGQVLGQSADITSTRLLLETNRERERNGEQALSLSTDLSRAAAEKAKDMFANQYWAHTSPTGVTPWHWIDQVGYAYEAAGENLAVDFRTTSGVVDAWMKSPEHRKNLLGKHYRDVGFAVVQGTLLGRSTFLVVAMYGEPQTTNEAIMPTVLAATDTASFMEKFGDKLQSGNPTLLASVVLLLCVAIVSLVAHQYRHQLPKEWRSSWRRHHALYKAIGASCLAVVVTLLYQVGQI